MKKLLIAAALLASATARAELQLLASIPPLGMIAAAVAGPHAVVEVLLPPGRSPHDFSLRPSDVQRLARAERVLWLGPALETPLQKPLSQLPAERVVALGERMGLDMESPRAEHGHGAHEGHEGEHGDHPADLHLWLDPRQAAALADHIAAALAEADPAHAAEFRANAGRFAASARALEGQLAARLAPLAGAGFAPTHDGFRPFAERFGLVQRNTLMHGPGIAAGARQMGELREQIERGEIRCLVSEAEFPLAAPGRIARETGVGVVELDPLAGGWPLGEAGYAGFMRDLADRLGRCLEAAGPKR